jgi:hypothetical protein
MADSALMAGDGTLDRVKFGRNRFLAGVGGSLFGAMATYFAKTELAWGLCGDVSPCVGAEKCCCCSGTECCQAGCHHPGWTSCGGFSPYCWNTCTTSGVRITCCDWINGNNEFCICRQNTGTCP